MAEMLKRILPWLCLALFVPLAAIGGSQAFPREVTVVKPVVVKPRSDWTTAQVARVFSAMQPVEVQAEGGVVQRTYANAGQQPLWAIVVLTASQPSGPAG